MTIFPLTCQMRLGIISLQSQGALQNLRQIVGFSCGGVSCLLRSS